MQEASVVLRFLVVDVVVLVELVGEDLDVVVDLSDGLVRLGDEVELSFASDLLALDRSLDVVTTLVRTLCNLGSGRSELLFELRDASFLGCCCAELLLLLLFSD